MKKIVAMLMSVCMVCFAVVSVSAETGITVSKSVENDDFAEDLSLPGNPYDAVLPTEAGTETKTEPKTEAETEPKTEAETENITMPKVYLTGDVNLDDVIDSADVLILQKFLAKLLDLSEEQAKACDVDGDGIESLNDVLILQKYLAKIILKLPYDPVYEGSVLRAIKFPLNYIYLGQGWESNVNARPYPSTAPCTLSYKSSNSDIAAVDDYGNITAGIDGTATITVTSDTGVIGYCNVVVSPPADSIKLDKTSLTLGAGEGYTLRSTVEGGWKGPVMYDTSDPTVAKVDSAGNVTATGVGTANITATTYNQVGTSCTVTVKEAPTKVELNMNSFTQGIGESYTLKLSFPNNTHANECLFTSSNPSVASVHQTTGKVTANAVGNTTITVQTYNGITAVCKVAVKKAPTSVSLNISAKTMTKGETFQLKRTVPADCYLNHFTYQSSKPEVVSVEKSGKITAKAPGKAVITLTAYNGKTAKCTITVAKYKVYLSPSNQDANTYIIGNTNEMVQCNKIAKATETALLRCGIAVKRAPQGQSMYTSISESNAYKPDVHLCIHTNGKAFPWQTVDGTMVMIGSLSNKKDYNAALALFNEIAPLSPGCDYSLQERPDLAEINGTTGMTLYLEVEHHDTYAGANWIINNTVKIGEATAKGICKGLGVAYVKP